MPRTRKAQRQSPPIRYKIPYGKHRLLLKAFLPPGCKRAYREVIDVAFRRLQTALAGGTFR